MIPAEYWGKARAFRARVAAGDRQHCINLQRVMAALQGRILRGHKTWRLTDIPDLFRTWSAPTYGQLPGAAHIQAATKTLIHFTSPMLVASTASLESWEDGEEELGVSIVRANFRATMTNCTQATPTWAAFNLHALARYYQRAFRTDDASLLVALWCTVAYYNTVLDTQDVTPRRLEFGLPVTHGGHWYGNIAHNTYDVDDPEASSASLCLDIRTFHADRDTTDVVYRERQKEPIED